MFDRLIWLSDRMLLDELVFSLEHFRTEESGNNGYFRFYKTKELVDQYEDFFSKNDLRPNTLLELGIFDGESTVFWNELFQPQKHVAVDIIDRTDSPYFQRYLESRGRRENIRMFWNTNQADKSRLHSIIDAEFDSPLDMVIDDASHLYEPTKASFEAVFPRCSPGALYIIEDWAWDLSGQHRITSGLTRNA